MSDIPGNQQSNVRKPTQGPAIPVFSQSIVIEWEYDIVPEWGQLVTGQTPPLASAVIQPATVHTEIPVPEGLAHPAADTGLTAAQPLGEPLPKASMGAGRQPESDGAAQSGAFYPNQVYSGIKGYAPAFSLKKKRLPALLITGVAVFVVIITGLLISGLRHHNGSVPADAGANSSMETTASASEPQEMFAEQEAFAATLYEKLQEALVSMSKDFTQDQVFLEAVSQAKLTDVVFSDNRLDFSIMLPDPRAESLDQLGVANYTPHSGAQAYIRDNYAKLCDMDKMTTVILIPATLYPKKTRTVLW